MKKIVAACLLLFITACKHQDTSSDTPMTIVSDTLPETSVHTCKNTIDWTGTYTGILPQKNSLGIEVALTLYQDNHYDYVFKNLDRPKSKPNQIKGRFFWNNDGNKIILDENELTPKEILMGEDKIKILKISGITIDSISVENYILNKVN